MLTQDQIARYHRDGYIVVQDVLDPAFVRRLQATVDGLVDRSRGISAHNEVYDLEPNHTAERPKVRRIKTPHKVDPVFDADLLCQPRLVEILQDLLGPNVRMMNSKLNLKEAGNGAAVEWHQDWAFYPHTNDDVLALGVMIDDCEMENGPLLIVPGTHQGPNHNHHQNGYFCGAMDPSECDVDFAKAEPCLGKAGSISLHHVRVVHGSAENTSPRARRLLLYQITAADAWPLQGVPDLAEFNSRMLAGEPTIEPRMTHVPVRMPLPPAPRQGSIYENQTALKNRYFGRRAESDAGAPA